MSQAFPYTAEEEDAIESILFSPEFMDEAMDLFGWHGMASAMVVTQCNGESAPLVQTLLGVIDLPEDSGPSRVLAPAFQKLLTHIEQMIESEEEFPLPDEIQEDRDALEGWCTGFAAGLSLRRDDWSESRFATEIASEVLPILTYAGALDEDSEFLSLKSTIRKDAEWLESLDTRLKELYLLFRTDLNTQ